MGNTFRIVALWQDRAGAGTSDSFGLIGST